MPAKTGLAARLVDVNEEEPCPEIMCEPGNVQATGTACGRKH
jgi:hypothetical protein